jgi:hypothetical protein
VQAPPKNKINSPQKKLGSEQKKNSQPPPTTLSTTSHRKKIALTPGPAQIVQSEATIGGMAELQPIVQKHTTCFHVLNLMRYYRHHLTNAMRYVHEYQDDEHLTKPQIVNILEAKNKPASAKDSLKEDAAQTVSDFLPGAEGSAQPADLPAGTRELKGLESYPLWRRSLLFAMLPPYAGSLFLTAITLNYNKAAYENVLSTCTGGTGGSSAVYNSTASILCDSGLNEHANALATGLLTCDTIAFISKCISFLMCLAAYLVHPSKAFNWSRKLGRYAWVMALAPPYLLLLIFPYRSVVNWEAMAQDMCDNTFSPMLTSQPYMEEMLRNAALEGTIDKAWASPPTCTVQTGSYDGTYAAEWSVPDEVHRAAVVVGVEQVIVDSSAAQEYANQFQRMHAFSCTDGKGDGSSIDGCASSLLPLFNTTRHIEHYSALANATRTCTYAFCKKHKAGWVGTFFNEDRWAFRRRLEKCNR